MDSFFFVLVLTTEAGREPRRCHTISAKVVLCVLRGSRGSAWTGKQWKSGNFR